MTKKHKPRAPRADLNKAIKSLSIRVGHLMRRHRASPDPQRRKAYVYALIDPRDGLPFYIGKGTGDRVLQHFKDFKAGRCTNALKTAFIAEIVEAGLEPVHRIIDKGLSDGVALILEAKIIAENRDIITNSHRSPRWKRDAIKARATARAFLDRVVYLYEHRDTEDVRYLPMLFKDGFIRNLTKFAYPDV